MKLGWLVLTIFIAGCSMPSEQESPAKRWGTKSAIGKAQVLHARNIGPSEFPSVQQAGYRLVKDYFTESDGSHQDAYVTERPSEFTLDYLDVGESCGLPFSVSLPESTTGKI